MARRARRPGIVHRLVTPPRLTLARQVARIPRTRSVGSPRPSKARLNWRRTATFGVGRWAAKEASS